MSEHDHGQNGLAVEGSRHTGEDLVRREQGQLTQSALTQSRGCGRSSWEMGRPELMEGNCAE